ncbi:response regulator [Methanoregula sp.]|uniref:response regulator n=1 Tax=Methanoregula sp. TaxID=2052170 RepID=UPI003BAEE287
MTGETILVVEDDGLIALNIIESLEKAGYRVVDPVESGEMALRALENSPKPDLIIIDIGLAGSLDGIETAREIRKRYSISLIFITGYLSANMVVRMAQIYPDEILIKPFLNTELLDKVEHALSR